MLLDDLTVPKAMAGRDWHVLPAQRGAVPDHEPSARHVRVSASAELNPSSHL